jgi:2-polyprenyl-3-methyl-5-hydroxy-6-metoxy-1,4-benzoquinol methylase
MSSVLRSGSVENRQLSTEQQAQEDQYVFPYHYLDLVDDYRRFIYNAPDNCIRELLVGVLEPFQGQSILDAGCGDGRLCYDLRNKDAHVVGCDYSEAALRFAKAFSPSVEFHALGLEDLDMKGQFDQVLFVETLEHIEPSFVSGVIRNIRDVLKPGGSLVLTVPSTGLPLEKKHYQHFTEASLRQHLEPFFDSVEIGGLHLQRDLMPSGHMRAKRLAKLLFPFRKSVAFASRAVAAYKESYRSRCLRCAPDRGEGLLAICRGPK